MISAWHLLWIIPFSACAGAICMALAIANGSYDHEREDDELFSDDL